MRTFRKPAGFTLIELLIAMAISSILGLMVYSLFVSQQRAMQQQSTVADVDDNGRVGIQLLTRDLRNAGFLLPSPASAIMIEDNCGAAGNTLGYDPATATWNIGGGANAMAANGDFVALKTMSAPPPPAASVQIPETCPNGSDRLTVLSKKSERAPTACNGAGCLTLDDALVDKIQVPCFNQSPSTVANYQTDCQQTLDMISPDVDVKCDSSTNEFSTTACISADATKCVLLDVTATACKNNCAIKGGGVMGCVELSLSNTPAWEGILGAGNTNGDDLTIGGYQARTYQLLDIDQDGATDLVYSDHAWESLLDPSLTVDPHWITVANDIDDLQFSWVDTATPNPTPPFTFNPISLYNMTTCTETGYGCLSARYKAPPNPGTQPTAIRVSLIARASKRDFGNSDAIVNSGRSALENNNPALQPYTTSAAAITGYSTPGVACTVANYNHCSGNGNAAGFRRRAISEVVGLRNFVSDQF